MFEYLKLSSFAELPECFYL